MHNEVQKSVTDIEIELFINNLIFYLFVVHVNNYIYLLPIYVLVLTPHCLHFLK